MKGEVKKGIILVGVVLVIVIFCIVRKQMSAVENYQDKYQGADLTVEVDGLGREGTYTEYQNSHETVYPSEDIPIDVCDYEEGTEDYIRVRDNVEAWGEMMDLLDDRVMSTAKEEGLLAERQPDSGTIKQFEEFMKKYGYRDGRGWWVKIER